MKDSVNFQLKVEKETTAAVSVPALRRRAVFPSREKTEKAPETEKADLWL